MYELPHSIKQITDLSHFIKQAIDMSPSITPENNRSFAIYQNRNINASHTPLNKPRPVTLH